jgi:uncharacterized phage-like protein YoqJ
MGYRYFLCGMAVGFDLEAAKAVISLRERLPGVEVIAVIPFKGSQERFSTEQRTLFDQIVEESAETITLATRYSTDVYARRNNYLVDNSSAVVTYFTGEKGGTAYTINRAVKNLSYIINIYNNPQQELTF